MEVKLRFKLRHCRRGCVLNSRLAEIAEEGPRPCRFQSRWILRDLEVFQFGESAYSRALRFDANARAAYLRGPDDGYRGSIPPIGAKSWQRDNLSTAIG